MFQKFKASAVFLFAHQDDETAVFQKILDEIEMDRRVYCIFFTTGVAKGADASRRNSESVSVLSKLGVAKDEIYFVGEPLDISDADLVNKLNDAATWLERFLLVKGPVGQIYVPAWEGGHPDHDVLHALGAVVGQKLRLLDTIRQYSLYNGYRCKGPLFRTFLPLHENGLVEKTKISWRNRFRFLAYCLQYPSQRMTWVGLFPMMLLHYVLWGTQNLQKVSMLRFMLRPHDGSLYYERRKFSQYETIKDKIRDLIKHV